jgi:hypothetical protein
MHKKCDRIDITSIKTFEILIFANNNQYIPLYIMVAITVNLIGFIIIKDVLKHEILNTFHRKRNFCVCIVVYGNQSKTTTVYPIRQK